MSSASLTRTTLRSLTRTAARTETRAGARAFSALATRPSAARVPRAASAVQVRGMKTIDFAGTPERVYERSDWPLEKLQDYFKNDTFALLGYGSQGHGQGLNLRDNGLNVIIGVRKDGASWKQAVDDGWVPGKNLFTVEEAAQKGTILMNLLLSLIHI